MRSIVHEAKQSRSRETEERISAAARELLRAQTLENVTMAEIATRAGVSIGGLYARFSSKEALAVHLAGRRVFEVIERHAAQLVDDSDADAADVLRRYLTVAATLYRQNRQLLRAVYVATRGGDDEVLRARVREVNARAHERLRTAILTRLPGASPRVVNLGILSMMAALREVVLFGQPVSDLARMSHAELARELVRQFLAYVSTEDPPGRKRR